MQRTIYFAIGLGALVFGALLAGGDGGFMAQRTQLAGAFGTVAIFVAVVWPALFSVFAYVLSTRTLAALAIAQALAFMVVQALWAPMMTGEFLEADAAPWLQGINAIPASLLAVAMRGRGAWIFALAQGPIVAVVQVASRADSAQRALLDGIGAMVFCLILVGVASGVVAAAARLDEVAERATRQAAIEASLATRDREQSRINAIVHDDIMSVLLAASRTPAPVGLKERADEALEAIASLTAGEAERRPYSPEELVALLRATVSEIADDVAFRYQLSSTEDVPSDVVAALAEATAEATRNSLRHAGRIDDPIRRAVAVTIEPGEVVVEVRDNGRGFSPRAVSQRRLGIRVSILERMRSLAGGDASVSSRPGAGTAVTLTWQSEAVS